MKMVSLLVVVMSICCGAFGPQADDSSEQLVIAGRGWGKVSVGTERKSVESVTGDGENRSNFDDVYFIDYPKKGIQISYNNTDNRVHAIFFYNRQQRYEHFASFKGKTDKGIDWKSTPADVIKAYGKPKEDHEGPGWGWRRLAFEGIDFRFENGTMVRIGIPGK